MELSERLRAAADAHAKGAYQMESLAALMLESALEIDKRISEIAALRLDLSRLRPFTGEESPPPFRRPAGIPSAEGVAESQLQFQRDMHLQAIRAADALALAALAASDELGTEPCKVLARRIIGAIPKS